MLQGIGEYVQGKTSIPVMYGSHATWLTPDTPDEMCMPAYSSLVGTLLLGASYRASHPIMKPTSNSLIKILKGKLEEKALTLFTDQEGEQEHNV